MQTGKLKNRVVTETEPKSTASLTVAPSISAAPIDREIFDITLRLQRPSLTFKEIFWLMAGQNPDHHDKIWDKQGNLYRAVKQALSPVNSQTGLIKKDAVMLDGLRCEDACALAIENENEPVSPNKPTCLSLYLDPTAKAQSSITLKSNFEESFSTLSISTGIPR